jgi:hypothetical protein
MIRTLFFAAIAVLFAAPAYAASIGSYPHVFVDDGCTDSYNAPGTYTQAQAALGLRAAVQTSGASDYGCDHDPRIRETALVADTTFGPFRMPLGTTGILVYADANTVSGGTDTWAIEILRARPVDRVVVIAATTASQATQGDKIFGFHPLLEAAVSNLSATGEIDIVMPRIFWIRMQLGTATSWDGTLSWEPLP